MSDPCCTDPRTGDLLAAYGLGVLPPGDCARIEAHLLDCPACLEELYAAAPIDQVLREDPGRYAGALRRAASGRGARSRAAEWAGRWADLLRPRVLAPLAAALVVTVVLLVGRPVDVPEAGSLARVQALPYVALETRGGPGGEVAAQVAAGMERYAAGDWAGAARELDVPWRRAGQDTTWEGRHLTALYLGVALLLDGQPERALAPLEAARTCPVRPVAERGTWYLAQANLKRGDARAALPLLEALRGSPVYGAAAAEQLIPVRRICHNPS